MSPTIPTATAAFWLAMRNYSISKVEEEKSLGLTNPDAVRVISDLLRIRSWKRACRFNTHICTIRIARI